MNIADAIFTAWRGITVNVFRSFLTTLGIIIGVGSVVLMTGVGSGMEGVILGQVSSLGAKSMIIFPGTSGPEEGASAVRPGFDSITFEDMEALEKLPSITSVAPVIFVPGEIAYGRETSSPTTLGTNGNFFNNQSIEAGHGRLISRDDDERARFVAVIGPDIAADLFPSGGAVGKRVKIGERTFTVVGITKPIGTQFFQNADERVFVPFSVAKIITGQKYLSAMSFQAVYSFDLAFSDVKYVLRRRHGINNPKDDPDKDDFMVRSAQQAREMLGMVSLAITIFITFVAGISLLVGGIGIMNIMLVAVTERTHEIGLRKALGAKNRDILFQFVFEAVMLTFIGGVMGVVCGIGISYFAAKIAQGFLSSYVFVVSGGAVAVALFTAMMTGLIFGIHPARRAASLNPIDALRYE